jgi:hypothetical protein
MPDRKKSIFGKTLELEDLDKQEALKAKEKPSGENAALIQRLQDAHALLFNTLQDAKQVKAQGTFTNLDKLRRDTYDLAVKCKAVSAELAEFLDSFGESEPQLPPQKASQKPEAKQHPSAYEHRRYLKR